MSESEVIDEILLAARESREIAEDAQNSPYFQRALHVVQGYNFIRFENRLGGRFSYEILEEAGHQVLDAGGFDAWRLAKQKREDELHRAALESAKGTVDAGLSAKRSYRLAVIVAIVSIIPTGLSIWQYVESKGKDEKIEALEQKVTSLTSGIESITASIQSLTSSPQKTTAPAPLRPNAKRKR